MTTFEASRGNRGHQMMTKELSAKIPKLYSQEEVSDPTVVAHYFTPYGRGDWFVIEWDGQDLMYGLADLGYPELGYFSLSELESAYRGSLPLVERDLYWTPVPLSEVKKTRMSAETFEAPKTMTKSQAKKKFVALAQPYWIKSMTSIKQTFEKEEKKYPFLLDSYPPSKVADKYLKMAKSGRFRALEWDYSDLVPDGFYNLVNYDRNDYDTWETTAAYFEGPKSVQKQLKALLPFIEGKVTVKPKAQKTTTRKSKPKAKTGRKGPDISATKRKIGTRMRGNDGNMWEVKPAGKSQRWVRGAEGKSPDGFNKSLVAIDLEYEGIEYCDYFIVPTNQISGFSEQELVSYFYDLEEEDWADENTFEPMMSHPTEVQEVMVWSLTPEEEKVLIKFGISGRYL